MKIEELNSNIEKVLKYLFVDEQINYSECEEDSKGSHIYNVLVELKENLKFLKKPGYTIVQVPEKHWDTMMETLSNDANSGMFDNSLQDEITEAINSIEILK